MKTHRPWQPHMGSSPLFNPYNPAGHATTLDHFALVEEQEQGDETEISAEAPPDGSGETPEQVKRD